MNNTNLEIILVILAMAATVFTIRLAGYWVASRFRISQGIERWLSYLPGCILTALVAPNIAHGSKIEIIGAVITVVVMWKTKSLLAAMITSILFVAAAQTLF